MPERVFLASPIASGRGGVIVSPFQFILTGDDHLRIEGWNIVPGAVLELSYRFADLQGNIIAERQVLPLTADRVSAKLVVPLREGYLVNMIAIVTGAAPRIGQTFCCVKLIRGLAGSAIVMGLLLQGYVTAEQGLGWPGSALTDANSVGGAVRVVTGTDPAAGLDISETVPAGATWELLAVRLVLVTSATVADRRPILILRVGGVFVASIPLYGVIPANQTSVVTWAGGAAVDTSPTTVALVGLLPDKTILPAGSIISLLTLNLQVADNYAAPTLLVRETLDVDA